MSAGKQSACARFPADCSARRTKAKPLLLAADGTLVRFAVSWLALLGISGGGPFHGTNLMTRFSEARPRIEAAAHAKLRERSTPPLGILHIREDDILDPTPGASPGTMQASMRRG